MKMKIIGVYFIIFFLSFDGLCKKVPKYIISRFTNCYDGNTNIKAYIEIEGYYELKRLFRTCSGIGENMICSDTLQNNIVFYEDGTFLYGFSESTPQSRGVDWGIYKIQGDTIVTQRIFDEALLAPWNAWEDKYLIINRNTLAIIPSESIPLYRTTSRERKSTKEYMASRKFLPAKFIKSKKIPLPNSWLKKEDWTKCK